MPLGRRVSKDVEGRFEADRALAAGYRDRLAIAGTAEQELRRAQAGGEVSGEDLRGLSEALADALSHALRSAEAAERVAMGTRTYATDDPRETRMAEIAARRARARSQVRPWTGEIDRLRTAREAVKIAFRDTVIRRPG